MSAPDVERLVEAVDALKTVFTSNRYRIRESLGDSIRWDYVEEAIEATFKTRAALSSRPDDRQEILAKLSDTLAELNSAEETIIELRDEISSLSRPNSIPPQDDVTGRLAVALRETLDWMDCMRTGAPVPEDSCSCPACEAGAKAEAILAVYRANRSGWIPVGERLPEDGKLWDIQLDNGSLLIGAVTHKGAWWWGGVKYTVGVTHFRENQPPQEGQG